MANLSDFITEILTGEYGQDVVNYGKDANGDFQPFEVTVDGKQYVVDEDVATKLQTLIDKDFATETTLDTRLSNLETKMDTLLNSQDTDNNLSVKQSGSIVSSLESGTDVSIEPDAIETVIDWVDVSEFRKLFISANHSASSSRDYRIVVRRRDSDGNILGEDGNTAEDPDGGQSFTYSQFRRVQTSEFPTKAHEVRIDIRNLDNEWTGSFSAWLGGVR